MKRKRYYLAYGSNLSVEQMKARAPDAKIVGVAILHGWQLLFRQFATISENPDYETPVLVWDISEHDEANLDRYEGFPNSYYKKELSVDVKPLAGGKLKNVTAMVYIMTECERQSVLPSPTYYNVLDAGYSMFGFDKKILRQAFIDSMKGEVKL